MRFGGFGFDRQFGFAAPRPAFVDAPPPVVLPNSEALTATGANLTLGALGADGMYPVETVAGVTTASYVASSGTITGDYLIELLIVANNNGAFAGADGDAPSNKSSGGIDECMVPDAGFGANKINFRKASTFGPQNITRNTAKRLFLERVGGTCNIYEGFHWGARSFLGTETAVSGGDRYFHFASTVAGQWRLRFIPHPG